MADQNNPAFYPRVGTIRPKPRSPLQQTEMRERPLDAAMGALKRVLDQGSELLDKNPAKPLDVARNLVDAIPFAGPKLANQFENSNLSVPLGVNFGSNIPNLPYGNKNAAVSMQAPGIDAETMPTKDLLNAMKWSDMAGTAGASRAAESLGYGQTPELFDLLDTAGVGAGLYGAAKMAPKVARAAKQGAAAVARPVGQAISDAMIHQTGPLASGPLSALAPRMAMTNVVKPKGGNWLNNSVEKTVKPLKSENRQISPSLLEGFEQSAKDATDPLQERSVRRLREHNDEIAVNKWVDSNLTGYMKKEMGTPEDPVRALFERRTQEIEAKYNKDMDKSLRLEQRAEAEADPRKAANFKRESQRIAEEAEAERDLTMKYIAHFPSNEVDYANMWVPERLGVQRMNAGYPSTGMGEAPAAKAWETISDQAIYGGTAGDYAQPLTPSEIRRGYGSVVDDNPWIKKLDPNTMVYHPEGTPADLGLDHVIDVLRQDVTSGRIRPEQLNKVSMEDAVRRAAEVDLEMARKMNASKAAAREGLPVYKEYPEEGYRWIELNKPGAFNAESEAMGHSVKGYEPPKGHPDWTPASGDLGSLSYGHGGWEAIKSGDAKVYSLVNKKGEPHVTVEAKKGKHPIGYSYKGNSTNFPDTFEYNNDFSDAFPRLTPEQKAAILSRAQELHANNPDIQRMDAFQKAADEVVGELPKEITQIKGKSNRMPNEDYLPYVQDFVRSGNWSDVGDIHNTGLISMGKGKYITHPEAKEQFAPRIQNALEFLQTHPAFEEQRAARAQKMLDDYDFTKQRELEKIYGQPIFPGSNYSATELAAVIKNPEEWTDSLNEYYPSLNRWLEETEKGMQHHGHAPPEQGMSNGGTPNRYPTEQEREAMRKLRESFLPATKEAERLKRLRDNMERSEQKGKVSFSDNPDTMMMELADAHKDDDEVHMSAAGSVLDAVHAARVARAARESVVSAAAVKRVLAIKDDAERAAQAEKLVEKMYTQGQVYGQNEEALRQLHKAQTGARALPTVIPRARPKTKEEIREYAQRTADQLNAQKQGQFLRANPEKSENAAGKSYAQWKMEQELQHDIRPLGKPLDKLQVANIEDQLGSLKMGISGDTTIADSVLHRAGPYELALPVEEQGGPLYGLRARLKPLAWASNEDVLSGVQRDINLFSDAYGGVPVIGQYNAMGPAGSNFAQHLARSNLNATDVSKMNPDKLERFNEIVKKGNAASGPHPDFPGIQDPGASMYLGFYPELRKYYNSLMMKPDITKQYGLPDGRVIQHAITVPELRDMPVLTSGHSQFELVPGQDPKNLPLSEHSTYSHDLPRKEGSPVKQTPFPIPAEFEFSDVKDYAEPMYKPEHMTRVYQTASPRQIVDQQHVDEIKTFEDFMRQYAPDSERKKKGGAIRVKPKKMAKGGEITGDDLILEERPL